MAKPKLYKFCTRCRAETILAFAELKVNEKIVCLCSSCARITVKFCLDNLCDGSEYDLYLEKLTQFNSKTGKKNAT